MTNGSHLSKSKPPARKKQQTAKDKAEKKKLAAKT